MDQLTADFVEMFNDYQALGSDREAAKEASKLFDMAAKTGVVIPDVKSIAAVNMEIQDIKKDIASLEFDRKTQNEVIARRIWGKYKPTLAQTDFVDYLLSVHDAVSTGTV